MSTLARLVGKVIKQLFNDSWFSTEINNTDVTFDTDKETFIFSKPINVGTVNGRDVAEDGEKLDGIEEGAQVNVNADWDSVSGDSQILNKPTDVTDLSTHASSELSDGADLVKGPASATDNSIARFDGTTGKLVQNSGAYIDDSGNVTFSGSVNNWKFGATGSDALMGNSSLESSVTNAALRQTATGTTVVNAPVNYVSIRVANALNNDMQVSSSNVSIRGILDLLVNANVGVGTATPSEKLDVVGNIKASGDSASATKTIDSAVQMSYDSAKEELNFTFL